MIIIGIDPGDKGGIVALDEVGVVFACEKMPPTPHDIADTLRSWLVDPDHSKIVAYIEDVHAMPKQGVSSSFKFGLNVGTLRGILTALQIRFELVTPQKWQKSMGCLIAGRKATDDKTAKKNANKAIAQRLFPQVERITHATADALLIAEYGRRVEIGAV